MHIAVGDVPAAASILERRVRADPALELDHPRVLLEVDLPPLVSKPVLGPVRLADHRDIGGLSQAEHLVEIGLSGYAKVHARESTSRRRSARLTLEWTNVGTRRGCSSRAPTGMGSSPRSRASFRTRTRMSSAPTSTRQTPRAGRS